MGGHFFPRAPDNSYSFQYNGNEESLFKVVPITPKEIAVYFLNRGLPGQPKCNYSTTMTLEAEGRNSNYGFTFDSKCNLITSRNMIFNDENLFKNYTECRNSSSYYPEPPFDKESNDAASVGISAVVAAAAGVLGLLN